MKNQKEEILPLFSEKMRVLIQDRHLSCESFIVDGRQLHVIYIADDERAKAFYKEMHVKDPDFVSDFYKDKKIDELLKK